MPDSVVYAEGLSKTYQIYEKPADRLLELATLRSRHRSFPALAGVSFDVQAGESLGIIGQNGAGKSTLLKLIAGVAKPTTGRLATRGTVASILELGAGFHPEFSGRDNAALNAAILGLSPAEMRRKLPRILEFSELGPFLDRPVRTYSSGMYMRLAFSVAVMVDPAVLIVDEALSVGDGYFQKKCVDRIRQMQEMGSTILFCSHSLYMVTTLCARTLWLDAGKVKRIGESVDVVHEYESFLLERSRRTSGEATVGEIAGDISIDSVEVVAFDGSPLSLLADDRVASVRARVRCSRAGQRFSLAFAVVRAADELRCCLVRSAAGDQRFEGPGSWEVEVALSDLRLARGDYGVVVFAETPDGLRLLARRDAMPAFRAEGTRFEAGVLRLPHRWEEAREA
ncbi:MAG: ATP-binding cassette domain-containing protein [Acidobacteria bacterium]|nr:ATP-binding cassette domain-containing protein [Acidobacteriota bacterium]